MHKEVKKVVVLGGGVGGWFTSAFLKKRHPELDITLIESPHVPILGVGESTVPPLEELLNAVGLDEKEWMQKTNAIYKLGNSFVGWNTEQATPHVTDNWNASKDKEQFYNFGYQYREAVYKNSYWKGIEKDDFHYDNDGTHGIDCKSYDYIIRHLQDENKPWYENNEYTEAYHLAKNNKCPYDQENYPLTGEWLSYAWHVDAERFPKIIRETVCIPLGVKWVEGHVEHINKDDDGYVTSLTLASGEEYEADLFCDCTGFHRILMKSMENEWVPCTKLFTQSAWVAPVEYKDPYKEMRPYTQSYANDAGWNFIIPLYSRMGSGYIFDKNFEEPEVALEKFKKFWDGYNFLKEPRLISWEAGYFKDAWTKNVVGVGMGQGFIDPMEANSIFVAQSCIELLEQGIRRYKGKVIPERTKKAYTKLVQKMENQIEDFISYHFTLSPRRDTPFWRHVTKFGEENGHIKQNWSEYRNPRNYMGNNVFVDYQWAQQQNYLKQFDENCEIVVKEDILPLAKIDLEFMKQKSKALSEYAPHIYDWLRDNIHEGQTHDEVLKAIK